ncbi:hypothetical protein ACFLUV_01340 [Elusimicrobiota bacterium]
MKRNKIISIISVFIIISFSFLGTIQIYQRVVNNLTIIKSVISFPSKPMIMINKFIKRSTEDFESKKQPVPIEDKEKKRHKLAEILYMIINSVMITGQNNIMLMMFLLAGFTIMRKKFSADVKRDALKSPPRIRHYKWWSLRFLTPLQKCIQNRSDIYDINPIVYNGRAAVCAQKI